MKTQTCIYLISYLLTILACNNNQKEMDSYVNSETTLKDEKVKLLESENDDTLLIHLFNKINPYELKKHYHTTSEVLSEHMSQHYVNIDSAGFFGRYYLLNIDSIYRNPFVAELVIFTHNEQWLANDPNERFIELFLYTPHIKFSENVFIGADSLSVKEVLGEPQKRVNDIMCYHENTIVLCLKLKENKISALSIGSYKNNINLDSLINEISNCFYISCL